MTSIHPSCFIHPSSIVEDGADIGMNTSVWQWVHIRSGSSIGSFCSFGQNVYVAKNVVIGNNVRVQNNVSIYDNVTLHDDVFCGPSSVFTNVINPRSAIPRKHEFMDTVVEKGATLGANCTIVCGNIIGQYAFIGVGAVVVNSNMSSTVLPFAVENL